MDLCEQRSKALNVLALMTIRDGPFAPACATKDWGRGGGGVNSGSSAAESPKLQQRRKSSKLVACGGGERVVVLENR